MSNGMYVAEVLTDYEEIKKKKKKEIRNTNQKKKKSCARNLKNSRNMGTRFDSHILYWVIKHDLIHYLSGGRMHQT